MGFVNEYVPDEDIEKYDLHGIWDNYHPLRKGRYYGGNRPDWTVDRQIDVFLLLLDIGRGEHGNRKTFFLWWEGQRVICELDLVSGSSGDLDADPFMRVWDLIRMELPPELVEKKADIGQILKKALNVYGYWGVRSQRPNTVSKFKF